jgi:hypothetical protein
MALFIALTTIFPPTAATRGLIGAAARHDARVVVAGDFKGPKDYEIGEDSARRVDFLSLEAQLAGPFALARQLPVNHYARKNIAYLHSIRGGASCIYETDDDNAPRPSWLPRSERLESVRTVASHSSDGGRWVNVYRYFTGENVWPRGFPLEELRNEDIAAEGALATQKSSIQQGLANRMPDVDAIWRLTQEREIFFEDGSTVLLAPGNWCPFNTQSTWWWPAAFPLLYVPSYCTFRMCDIWKSFVAQRCLWAMGQGVAFHAAEVEQDRNVHDLFRDFEQEIPGYTQNKRICSILMGLALAPGAEAATSNLRLCYAALVSAGIFPEKELQLVDAWIDDLARIGVRQ